MGGGLLVVFLSLPATPEGADVPPPLDVPEYVEALREGTATDPVETDEVGTFPHVEVECLHIRLAMLRVDFRIRRWRADPELPEGGAWEERRFEVVLTSPGEPLPEIGEEAFASGWYLSQILHGEMGERACRVVPAWALPKGAEWGRHGVVVREGDFIPEPGSRTTEGGR